MCGVVPVAATKRAGAAVGWRIPGTAVCRGNTTVSVPQEALQQYYTTCPARRVSGQETSNQSPETTVSPFILAVHRVEWAVEGAGLEQRYRRQSNPTKDRPDLASSTREHRTAAFITNTADVQ